MLSIRAQQPTAKRPDGELPGSQGRLRERPPKSRSGAGLRHRLPRAHVIPGDWRPGWRDRREGRDDWL